MPLASLHSLGDRKAEQEHGSEGSGYLSIILINDM